MSPRKIIIHPSFVIIAQSEPFFPEELLRWFFFAMRQPINIYAHKSYFFILRKKLCGCKLKRGSEGLCLFYCRSPRFGTHVKGIAAEQIRVNSTGNLVSWKKRLVGSLQFVYICRNKKTTKLISINKESTYFLLSGLLYCIRCWMLSLPVNRVELQGK